MPDKLSLVPARGENDYVILADYDRDNVALDRVKTIDIEKPLQPTPFSGFTWRSRVI